jgi:hypothetical protein
MTFCYDRLQLFDIVNIIHGPMTGKKGHVVQIRCNGYLIIRPSAPLSNGTWKLSYLNIYRGFVVIEDRLCVGDSVVVKEGPPDRMRGNVVKINLDGLVTFDRAYGDISSNVRIFVSDSVLN